MARKFCFITKKNNPKLCIQNATLIHAWGPVMTISMGKANVDMDKVLVLPKGIDLSKFHNQNTADPEKIHAIVTRSLSPEYRHAIILNSFNLLHQKELTSLLLSLETELATLKELTIKLNIEKGFFTGRIPNTELPELLRASNFTLVCQSLKEYQHRYLKRWPLIVTPL
jgi:glycosyltransferase involved in cell wall biosynthesis